MNKDIKIGFWYSLFLRFMGYKSVWIDLPKGEGSHYIPNYSIEEKFPIGSTFKGSHDLQDPINKDKILKVIGYRDNYIVKGSWRNKIHRALSIDNGYWVYHNNCTPVKKIWINPLDYKLIYGKEKRGLNGKNRGSTART